MVKTSTLPEGGRSARLIDAGDGDLTHLDGKQIEGAVVLMDFNTGDAWLNSGYLGAAGVVFIEPDSTVYLEGERKFLTMPLDLPRYWVPQEEGIRLRERIALSPTGEIDVHMEYRMAWERRPAWNILGTIPGSDPLLQDDVIVLESYYDAMSVVPRAGPRRRTGDRHHRGSSSWRTTSGRARRPAPSSSWLPQHIILACAVSTILSSVTCAGRTRSSTGC